MAECKLVELYVQEYRRRRVYIKQDDTRRVGRHSASLRSARWHSANLAYIWRVHMLQVDIDIRRIYIRRV